jgi:methylated-DNA-[protein]-cysteine S-methyltransferase
MTERAREGEAIRWYDFDSPVGRTYAAVGDRGLCRLTWHTSGSEAFQHELAQRFPNRRVVRDAGISEGIAAEIREYFSGDRHDFDLEIDLSGLTDFERDVLEEACRIPYGTTIHYSELARRIGRPGAARAVGNALRENPLPILVPCHRITRADGTPGGYGGPDGTPEKVRLLNLEAGVVKLDI